jgi:Bacterial Ig-like domain (group 1)
MSRRRGRSDAGEVKSDTGAVQPRRRQSLRAVQIAGALLLLTGTIAAFVFGGSAHAGTGPGASGNTIPGAAEAQGTFTPNSPFDSGQPIDVVVPANSVLNPGATIFVLECAAPNGVNPTSTAACDGDTGYAGGTISVNDDGSIDVIQSSTNSGIPYDIYALPDMVTFGESAAGVPKCGLGAANECVLYIGQGGGNDIGFSQPHFFSQPFQVHTDPTDSGTLDPGDGSPAPVTSVSSSLSTVSPTSQSVTADGADPATVTVTLKDSGSSGVAGKTVTLTPQGGHSTVTPASTGSDVTDADGDATFSVTDATAESVTYSASDTTDSIPVTQTGQVTFVTPTVNLAASMVTASPTSVANDGTTPATVTVNLRDTSVHGAPAPIAGRTIVLTAKSGSSVIAPASSGSAVTDADGVATFSVTDAVNEVVTYQAQDSTDSILLTSTATVTFGAALPVSASASTVTANPTSASTGPGGTTVTVTLLAADGTTPITGKSVTLSVSGSAVVVGGSEGTSDGSGQVTFGVTDQTIEPVTISAADTSDSVSLDATATVTFAAPTAPTVSPTASSATVSGSPTVADGSAQATISVTVINTDEQPMAGVAVTIAIPDGDEDVKVNPVAQGDTPGTTNAQGQTAFQVHDTTAQSITLTVTAGGVQLSNQPVVDFIAGAADAETSTVTASPSNVAADGSTASTVTATLTDHSGNPVQGKTVTLVGLNGNSTVSPTGASPGVTNAEGVTTFSVTDSTSEVVTYSATDSTDQLPISQLASVTFGTPPPVVPVQGDSTVTANAPTIAADGTTTAVITVLLGDANGFPVAGKTVSLSPSAGSSVITAATVPSSVVPSSAGPSLVATGTAKADVVSPDAASSAAPTATTNSNGVAVFDATDTVAETVVYTATDTTDNVTGWTVSVTYTAATATTSTTTTTTVPTSSTTTTTTASAGGSSSGTDSTGDSSGDSDGSGSSGTSATSAPDLAFTGAPSALPWLFGLGFACLLLGTLGRKILSVRRRDQ